MYEWLYACFALFYLTPPQDCPSEMFVCDIESNTEIKDKGYLNTAESEPSSLAALSESYFSHRYLPAVMSCNKDLIYTRNVNKCW